MPLHSLLENARLRVFSYHELRSMLLQLRLGGWTYPHLFALCILFRHVYVRVRAVTATILRVFALLHSVTHLSARHCRLVPAGHAVDLSEFSNRPHSLRVTGTGFADPQAMPTCPHMSAQAPCLDSLTYGSNAFEFACLLSFLALYKRLYVVSSVHCAVALHSACRLFSLRSVPPPAHTLLLNAPQPMDTTHTMLNILRLSAIHTIHNLVLTACNILFFLAWLPMVFASLRTRRTAAYDVPGPATGRPLPPDPTAGARVPTHDTLTYSSLNVGGVEITPNRLCHLLGGYGTLPHVLSLQEYRPSSLSTTRDHVRVALYWGYHMLLSSPSSKEGVALLIHTSISPGKPTPTVHLPGRLISTQVALHTDPLMPPVTVCSFYGPHTARERLQCEKVLASLLQKCSIILGDYNGVTRSSDATTLHPNLWPWLIARERSGAMIDLVRPHCDAQPYTRVRRYGGTKSYIDRAYGSRMFVALYQSEAAGVLDFSRVYGVQDHDPIIVHTIPWATPHVPEPRCAMWNRRDVTRFQKKISESAASLCAPQDARQAGTVYDTLVTSMLSAMREVNEEKKEVPKNKIDVTDWSDVVRQLAKQAKRRSKLFYRRVKHTLLTPPTPSTLPTPTRKIQRILQRNNPWSARALDWVNVQPRLDDLPPPTVTELRSLAKASRRKSPGPDGVPPYLIASLPDPVFSIVHQCICRCYDEGSVPEHWLISETFCLFKGKGQWQDPDRWRPIAMSNSIYRLLMRWVHNAVYPLLSPQLHCRQFGGRQGTSTAHATHTFLDDMDRLDSVEAILAFDVYHAFDSPPKYLIHQVLDRMGTPLKLLRILSLVLERGATFIRGAEGEVFRTSHGVKQGCPMSCFLFVLVFDIPLRYLSHHGVVFSAYVDDISSPAPRTASQTHASLVQLALSLIGCQLNVTKSESLSMSSSPPPLAVLPKYLHPPDALQVHPDTIWLPISADVPPWADEVPRPFTRTACLMHLGHPLPARLHIPHAVTVITSELKAQLNELHSHPIQVLDRVLLVNSMVLPRLLYRTECLPLTAEQTTQFGVVLERFVFGVVGLPMVVAKKTLYTHRSRGLGMGYFPVLHPTRVLDLLHRNQFLHAFSLHPRCSMTPYSMFCSALTVMGPPSTSTVPPVFISWEASKLQREATAVMSVAGLVVFVVPSKLRPECTYTDGSKLGVPPASGAAAIMPGGRIAVCRVPGVPNSYKAELVGMLLGSHFSGEGEKIRLDCQGAIASALGQKRPIRQAGWVQKVRHSLSAKGQRPEWVEGHVGHEFNEASDRYARLGTALPPPPLHGPLLPGTLFGMASPWFPPTKSGHTTWPQAIPTKTSTRCHGGH